MTKYFFDRDADPILKAVVHRKAQRMVGHAGLTQSDVEDIEQYLYEKLLKSFSIGPNDSPRGALLETVVDRLLAKLARDRRAQKRDPRRSLSLSIVVEYLDDEGPVELADTVTDRERDAHLCIRRRSDQETFERASDVAALLAKMSPKDRDLCERLMHDTIAQVARDLGIPRTTVHDHVGRLRTVFQDENLSEYL